MKNNLNVNLEKNFNWEILRLLDILEANNEEIINLTLQGESL